MPYTDKQSNYLGTFKLESKSVDIRTPDSSLRSFSHFLPTRLIEKYVIEERNRALRAGHIVHLIRVIDQALEQPDDAHLNYRLELLGLKGSMTIEFANVCKESEREI